MLELSPQLPAPLQVTAISLKGEPVWSTCEPVNLYGAPAFATAAEKTHPNHLALVTSRSCIHRFSGTVANKGIVLNWLFPQSQHRGNSQKCLSLSLFVKEANLHILKATA